MVHGLGGGGAILVLAWLLTTHATPLIREDKKHKLKEENNHETRKEGRNIARLELQ